MRRIVLLSLLALTACSEKEPDPAALDAMIEAVPSIEDIADNYINAYLERFPEMATYYGLSGYRHHRLTDMSQNAISESRPAFDAIR